MHYLEAGERHGVTLHELREGGFSTQELQDVGYGAEGVPPRPRTRLTSAAAVTA